MQKALNYFYFYLDGKKGEKASFISKFGLDDWKSALPLAGILLIIPALQNQVSFPCVI